MENLSTYKKCIHCTCCLISLFAVQSIVLPQSTSPGSNIKQGSWRGQEIEYFDRVIVIKLRDGVQFESATDSIIRLGAEVAVEFNKLGWGMIRLSEARDIFLVIDSLYQRRFIETAEPAFVGHADYTPNDKYFLADSQWALYNHGQNPPGDTTGADIKVRQAWDITRGSSNVLVAILDSGIPLDSLTHQLSHPDFLNSSRVKLGRDFLYGDSLFPEELESSIRDIYGHGTHVAGILGAETNNDSGIAGVAGSSKLLIIQVFRDC